MVESFFAFFGRLVLILSQSDHFAKPVAFAYLIGFVRLLIFKIVSFLEYLVFFQSSRFAFTSYNLVGPSHLNAQ